MLKVSGLTLGYGGEPVLEDADLNVEAGQFVNRVGRFKDSSAGRRRVW